MQRRLTEYIRKPDTLDAHAIAALRNLLQRSPYCHSARILLLHALYRMHDPAFDEELRRSALLVPNRQSIFRLIEEKHYLSEQHKLRFDYDLNDEEETGDRTETLIDSFLHTLPEEKQTMPRVVDDICVKLTPQTSNLKPQTSNFKSQASSLKPQTSNFQVFRMSFERKNLAYRIQHAPDKFTALIQALTPTQQPPSSSTQQPPLSSAQSPSFSAQPPSFPAGDGSAIVYVRSRRHAREIAEHLC
jgi:superfamily II DNA helicase RecQ